MSKTKTPAARKRAGAKKAPAAKKPAATKNGKPSKGWILRLYVAGQTPKSLTAFANLKRLCEEHLVAQYEIEVVDLAKHPQLAASDQIVALPTLVRRLPPPIKRVVGDLSNTQRVIIGMDLMPSLG